MITANYIFKEAIMTQGMKFYKTKSLESQKNINTYEDFINYIVAQNFGRYFFQIIYDEAIRTQKTYDEILDKIRQETGLQETNYDNMLEKEFEILKSVLETELLKIGIDLNEKINDAKLVELLRKVGSNEYEQESNLLEEWIEEVLEEISDSVSEDIKFKKKTNSKFSVDMKMIENECSRYADENYFPKEILEKLYELTKCKLCME